MSGTKYNSNCRVKLQQEHSGYFSYNRGDKLWQGLLNGEKYVVCRKAINLALSVLPWITKDCINMKVDEYETIRLIDLEGLTKKNVLIR